MNLVKFGRHGRRQVEKWRNSQPRADYEQVSIGICCQTFGGTIRHNHGEIIEMVEFWYLQKILGGIVISTEGRNLVPLEGKISHIRSR